MIPEELLQDLKKRQGSRPGIGFSSEETIITPKGNKLIMETERSSLSATGTELGILILAGALGWWVYNDGPQKTAASALSGIFGAAEKTVGFFEGGFWKDPFGSLDDPLDRRD